MSLKEFYNYIIEKFNLEGASYRLINNILIYVEQQGFDENESYRHLCMLLDGTIGLSDKEIKLCNFTESEDYTMKTDCLYCHIEFSFSPTDIDYSNSCTDLIYCPKCGGAHETRGFIGGLE